MTTKCIIGVRGNVKRGKPEKRRARVSAGEINVKRGLSWRVCHSP
jgi:hypothetical protein